MLLIGLIICLMFVFFQDWKERKIYWFLPLLILLCTLILSILTNTLGKTWLSLLGATGLLAFLWVYVVFRFKNKQLFKGYFGVGDACMLIAIAPLFSLNNYFWFISVGSLISVLVHFIIQLIKPTGTIPFAGNLAFTLVLIILINFFFPARPFLLEIYAN